MFTGARIAPVLLIVAAGANAQDRRAVTAGELFDLALQNNRDLAALREQVRQAQGTLRQAGVRPAPTLEVTGASGRPLRTKGEESYAAGISRPFETGGKRAKRVRVAELGIAIAEAEVAERIAELRRSVRLALAEAVADSHKLRAIDSLLALLRESLRLTEARVAEGDAARLDAQLLRVEIGRNEAQRAALAGEVEGDLLDLRRLAGLGADAPLTTPDDPLPPGILDVAAIQRRAIEQRPDLRAARAAEEQAESAVALAEAEGRPDVTVSAGYTRQYGRFDDQLGISSTGANVPLEDQDHILSAGISIPLTGRKRNLGNIEAAAARSRSARLRREHLERTIPLEIAAAVRRHEALQRSAAITRDSVLAEAGRNVETIRQAYALGQLRLFDVLNEQRRLLDLQLGYADSLAEQGRALAELERAAGGNLP